MKKSNLFVCGVLLWVLVFAPIQTSAQTSTEAAYQATLLQLIELLQQQILTLQAELNDRLAAEQLTLETGGRYTDSVQTVAVYTSSLTGVSNSKHQQYFSRVLEIFPAEYDKKLDRFMVFDGAEAEFDAYVETLPPQHDSWMYAVNEDILEDDNSYFNDQLIIHELAHIVSYEKSPTAERLDRSICNAYFDRASCPSDNSYLGQFVAEVWSTTDLRRAEDFSEQSDSLELAYEYYENNTDEFVTDYAALSPEEDFSESFMFFILEDEVTAGEEASQKIDFFQSSAELLSIRDAIRQSL